jgi:hypothetical protein
MGIAVLSELKQWIRRDRPHVSEELSVLEQLIALLGLTGMRYNSQRHRDALINVHLVDGFQRVQRREWLDVVVAEGDVLAALCLLRADDARGTQEH